MMHLNDYGLNKAGFVHVASFRCFSKGKTATNIDCYTNGSEYLVRTYLTGHRAYDNVYDNKDDANKHVARIFGMYDVHRRMA